MKFTSLFAAAVSFTAVAFATPVKRSALDVWDPKVTFPSAGTVLTVGSTYDFTWDTSDAPAQITNQVGALFLRKGNIQTPVVLAGGFNITDGTVKVTLPWALPDDDYSAVLFGDSGDFSPTFVIDGPSPFTLST